MIETSTDDHFYTTRDAASVLKVSVKTAQLWVEGGILQAWKTPGGHRRITHRSVQHLLDQRQLNDSPVQPKASVKAELPQLLVVDDDARIRQLYELTIKHWGLPFQLTMANDGFEGLLSIGEKRPDMLVTDLDMPGMNGFKMIASLRAVERYRKLPIVVISGMSSSEIRGSGGLPEDIPVLSKPIPFSQLRKFIERSLLTK